MHLWIYLFKVIFINFLRLLVIFFRNLLFFLKVFFRDFMFLLNVFFASNISCYVKQSLKIITKIIIVLLLCLVSFLIGSFDRLYFEMLIRGVNLLYVRLIIFKDNKGKPAREKFKFFIPYLKNTMELYYKMFKGFKADYIKNNAIFDYLKLFLMISTTFLIIYLIKETAIDILGQDYKNTINDLTVASLPITGIWLTKFIPNYNHLLATKLHRSYTKAALPFATLPALNNNRPNPINNLSLESYYSRSNQNESLKIKVRPDTVEPITQRVIDRPQVINEAIVSRSSGVSRSKHINLPRFTLPVDITTHLTDHFTDNGGEIYHLLKGRYTGVSSNCPLLKWTPQLVESLNFPSGRENAKTCYYMFGKIMLDTFRNQVILQSATSEGYRDLWERGPIQSTVNGMLVRNAALNKVLSNPYVDIDKVDDILKNFTPQYSVPGQQRPFSPINPNNNNLRNRPVYPYNDRRNRLTYLLLFPITRLNNNISYYYSKAKKQNLNNLTLTNLYIISLLSLIGIIAKTCLINFLTLDMSNFITCYFVCVPTSFIIITLKSFIINKRDKFYYLKCISYQTSVFICLLEVLLSISIILFISY